MEVAVLRTQRLLVALAWVLLAGCASHVKSMYIGSGTPIARPDSAQVEVFLRSDPPSRPYLTVGEVEVSTDRTRRRVAGRLLHYARKEVRKMGGDALIVETHSHPTSGTSVPSYNYATGGITYHHSGPGMRMTLKGSVIVWKE